VRHLAPFDLGTLLPVLTHYAGDGGPFVTTGVVLCTDPATGRRGMGIHRMMVKGGTRMGILLANPPLSAFLANAEATGKPLDIAVALGVEPALLIAAVVKAGPQGPDKMDIAGALRQAPVEMIRAETVAVDVPARAEIIIEGRSCRACASRKARSARTPAITFPTSARWSKSPPSPTAATSSIRPCAPGPPTSTACCRWPPAPNCWASCAPRWPALPIST
jgi:hypothetical protein